jgi:hypothetical protein
MMTAAEVIESYVRDVARHLPRKRRNDVAFELRALLHEELAAKCADAGKAPDRGTAMALLAGFGRPADVAARYHPRPPLVDPGDNHDFMIWTLAGVVVPSMSERRQEGMDLLHWLGLLFVVFAAIAWWRRRQPADRFAWRPRAQANPASGARWPALLAAAGLVVFPLAMYLSPQAFWDTATFGHGVSGGLALTDAFAQSWQRIATIGWLAAYIAVWLAVAAQDGWRKWSRQAGILCAFGLGMMLLAHSVPMTAFLDRTAFAMFVLPGADATAMPWFRFAGAILVLGALYESYQEWVRVEPSPSADAVPARATPPG